jgi:hypothetical protein
MRPEGCLIDTTHLHVASGHPIEVNVTMPAEVDVGDIVIRPTAQD